MHTDLPTILSGDIIAFLEPHEEVWHGQSGQKFTLLECHRMYQDSLAPYDGICGFSAGMNKFSGTLFRFPLRNEPSKLSDSQYSIEKLRALTHALKSDAKLLLLFLRSVDAIEVHEIRQDGSHEQVFCVTIHDSDRETVLQQRQQLTSQLKVAHKRQSYRISQQIMQGMDFRVQVTNDPQSAPSDSHWLVTNLIGCTLQDVLAAACELRIFPCVGVAMELTEHPGHENGRIFCFLPLSSDASSHLPVHLNGTFGISSNRRALKWSGSEAQNDSAAQWNELLVKHLIPLCYEELLGQAKQHITLDQFYQTWPDVTSIKQSPWEELLLPLLQSLFEGKNVWVDSPLQQWIAPDQGTFIPKCDPSFPQVVERVLAKCRLNLVKIPQVIWDALQHSGHDVSTVTPSYTRQAIRGNFISYKDLSSEDKQQLLTYCLSDSIYSDLKGLALLPLANGEFACFQSREYASAYICSKDTPCELLPNLDHLLVDLSQQNQRLHEALQTVAASNLTNLQQLSVSTVAQQLPSCMPADWRNQQMVTPSSSSYPLDWFKTFWEWMRRYNHNLQHFTGELVVPISKGAGFNVIRLSRSSAVVYLSVYCHPDLRQALTKLNVKIADQYDFPYLYHHQLFDFLHKFSADGVLSAIACAHQGRVHQVKNVYLTVNEACEMRSFLANSLTSFNSKQREVLCNLPIFTIIGEYQLYSVQQAEQQSKCGSVMVEPQDFDIQICIPSNVVILSQSNQVSLLSSTQKVQTPNKLQFILSILFPLVHSGHYPDHHLDSLMVEVLRRVPVLKSQFPACQHTELMSSIGSLCFIKTSNGTRKAPKELFDPLSAELNQLYKHEPVFPIAPFDSLESHLCLRDCGLQFSVNAQQVVLIIEAICVTKTVAPASVNHVRFSRAKAVLKYLSCCESQFFSEEVTLSTTERCTMGQAISILAIKYNWLPVCPKPPDEYPSCLVWKGSACTCHLALLTSEVLVPTSGDSDTDTLHIITGSQMYIVDCSVSSTLYIHLMSSLSTSHSEIAMYVWKHFQQVITQQQDIHHRTLDLTVCDIYSYFEKHGNGLDELHNAEWIWINKHQMFIRPEVSALKENHTFPHNLEPYVYVIPERLAQDYSSLFRRYGVVEELSLSQIVSVLKMIKDRKRTDVAGVTAMKVVLNILEWLTDDGMRKPELRYEDALLVPIQSTLDYPELVPPADSVYTDNAFLQGFLESSDSANKFTFINQQITSEVAHMLGVTPLSRHLNISEDTFEDVGQHEPLITRLKNILEEYRDGVTIIKELLQNADDAEAKEVNICYDARSHDVPPKSLLYAGMLRCHGPALVVHNDASFTKDDFMNITKLAGETKTDKPLKIGKFGVGFCSVYHITDIPSFVSQEMLYIFDPTMSHLGKEIRDPARPGKKVKFTDMIVTCSRQLEPFEGLYGFDKKKSYKGTIFRLPFRTSHSDISSIVYTENAAKELSKSIQKSSSQLLLFLQNVTKITYSQINPGETSPTVLYEIRKHSTTLSSNPQVSIYMIECSPSTSQASQEYFLVATHVDNAADFGSSHKYATASVACLLDTAPSPSTPSFLGGHCYIPRTVAGEIFCFLPLAVHSGLPVHVSCNFAVMKSRKGIQTSSDPSDTLAQFNIGLMEHVIPQAYCNLLEALQGMCEEGNVPQESYKFFSLWPLKEKLKTHNPWEHLIGPIYKLISSRELLFSEPIRKWVTLAKSEILHPGILSTWPASSNEPPLKCVINVVQILGCQLVDLPAEYREQLPKSELDSSIMDEHRFVQLFFSNITLLKDHQDTRNEVLKNILQIFSIVSNQCSSNRQHYLEGFLRNNQCVPCTPVGAELKSCIDIVNPLASFARLYDREDGVFPITSFCTNKLITSALTQLGMVQDHMPWDMLVERATTIQELYQIEQIKALERAKLIIECINRNLINQIGCEADCRNIASISFLPVKRKPNGYPLLWKGESYRLLTGKELLCNTEANIRLAGSQLTIVCDSSPNNGGCGTIPSYVRRELKIAATPSCHVVIEQLCKLVEMFTEDTGHTTPDATTPKSDITWVENICSEVYKYLDNGLGDGLEGGTISNLHRLTSQQCLWTGECFVSPNVVARKWLHKGPYLFSIPHTIKYKSKLTDALGIKETFVFEDFVSALERIQEDFPDQPVTDGCIQTISVIIPELCACDNIPDEFACFLPDDKSVMCRSSELAYNDAPWCQIEEEWRFVHTSISRDFAIKLGVKPVRRKLLERYESPSDNFGGVEFGQSEILTQRIKNILTQYPCDETVLKELLQNADDAMATKMYVIFDKRTHGKERVPKREWADLQGPALLVWNDSTFTEKDLEGIQQLGLGSKRSDEDSIGQYGIGFNVVYNLTDCPSFITDCGGETLCVLDPHCRYIPGANKLKPGRRYNKLDERFWSNYADLETAYLRKNISDCPPEMKRGTLFRFPLRSTPELVKRSELVDKENSKSSAYNNPRVPISLWRMQKNIEEWVTEIKRALFFLNHVTEIKYFVIKEHSSSMTPTTWYEVILSAEAQASRATFHGKVKTFKKAEQVPYAVHYPLTLVQRTLGMQSQYNEESEIWLIQQGVGDQLNPEQEWRFTPQVKPKHGIAAPLKLSEGTTQHFRGTVFCFLPLPVASRLPVHVNGNFILDSSRRDLWHSTKEDDPDDRTKWNKRLVEAIASSYVKLLASAQDYYIDPECLYENMEELLPKIKCYYSTFPTWLTGQKQSHIPPEGLFLFLAKAVYEKLEKENETVMATITKLPTYDSQSSTYTNPRSQRSPGIHLSVEWHPLRNKNKPSKQVHFCDTRKIDKELTPILESIGMQLSTAPIVIRKHFSNLGIELPKTTRQSVFQYYNEFHQQVSETNGFPCQVSHTTFKSVGHFQRFSRYLLHASTAKLYYGTGFEFPEEPFGLPLLLTADGQMRVFDKDNMVICSTHCKTFPQSGDKFLHPEMIEMKYIPTYFTQASDTNWTVIEGILQAELPNTLKATKVLNVTSHIDHSAFLRKLWLCLSEDEVFKHHLKAILRTWALLLSTENQLFSFRSWEQLLPMIAPDASDEQACLYLPVFRVLQQASMPVLDINVVPRGTATSYCPTFLCSQRILTSLFFLHKIHAEEEGLTMLLSESDSDRSIMTLFEYFKDIHFGWDPDSLYKLKCLPLFKDISGQLCTLEGRVYIWPSQICSAGCNRWLTKTNVVFLNRDGAWTILGSAAVLDIKAIPVLRIYIEFIFPYFDLLMAEERIQQLEYIRDQLFDDAHNDTTSKDYNRRLNAIQFIDALEALPCLPLPGGELRPVRDFCDPDVLLFTTFHEGFYFPPHNLCSPIWLEFLRKIGLRQRVTNEEFIQFCRKVSKGDHQDLVKASDTLLKYLMKAEEWYSDDVFLAEVSTILFVCAEHLPLLNWIKPTYQAENRIQQGRKVVALTCLDGAALHKDCSTLLWTVKSIVKLPSFAAQTQLFTKAEFLEHIGVITTPKPCDVVNNIKNISKSRFSSFALFDKYTDDCKQKQKECSVNCLLLSVLKDNFHFLHQQLGSYSETILHPLRELPCIPVCAEGRTSNIKQPVLVHPLQVITEGKECRQAHPFINPLPDVLIPFLRGVLSKIGVESTIKPIHVRKALDIVHGCIKQPLDPNTVDVVRYLLKQLYLLLKDSTEAEKYADTLSPLFLPNADHKLVQSTFLICNDKHLYRKIPLDFSSLRYSLVGLLSSNPRRELGFTPQEFCNCLPQAVSPILLSSCCEEKLHSSCTEVVWSTCISDKLHHTFNLHMYIARAARLIINYEVQAVEQECLKFTTTLQEFLQNTKIVVYEHLLADIFLTLDTPRMKIGTAEVPFLIQKSAEQTFRLCLSKVSPLNLLPPLASSIVSCVAQQCGVDLKALGNPDSIIERLLTAEGPDHIVDILEDLDVPHESLEMDDMEIPLSNKILKLGDPVPFELHFLLDPENIFRPEELVGYEEHTDYIIFARVVYRIRNDAEGEEEEEGYARYLIYTREDDESGKIVSVLDLYKFTRVTESMLVTNSCEVAIPEDSDATRMTRAFHEEGGSEWKKIKKEICSDLRRIWKLPEEEKRKGTKRLYLKWHPDKNDHWLATKAFQFLKQQIARLEVGLPLDEDNEDGNHETPSCWRPWWDMWDDVAARHGRSRARDGRGGLGGWGGWRGWRGWSGWGGGGGGGISSWWYEMMPQKDLSKAKVWLQQAEVDMKVLKTILVNIDTSPDHAGHICFLAHEVAEKALKAGKYATCGLHSQSLRNHQLVIHAEALEQLEPQLTFGLLTSARALSNYYIETRFPNHYSPPSVPADHFTPDQAKDAHRNAEGILQVMRNVVK